jgi:hypothetical protein
MRTAAKHISISATRTMARRYPYAVGTQLHALIDAAETLRRLHEADCGCDRPGTVRCLWPPADGGLVASFDFDEEVVER